MADWGEFGHLHTSTHWRQSSLPRLTPSQRAVGSSRCVNLGVLAAPLSRNSPPRIACQLYGCRIIRTSSQWPILAHLSHGQPSPLALVPNNSFPPEQSSAVWLLLRPPLKQLRAARFSGASVRPERSHHTQRSNSNHARLNSYCYARSERLSSTILRPGKASLGRSCK